MTDWQDWAKGQLATLLTLKAGWDSYGAKAVTRLAVERASFLIEDLAEGTPRPCEIVPRVCGGVTIRWATNNWECNVDCSADGQINVTTETVERCGHYFGTAAIEVNDFMARVEACA